MRSGARNITPDTLISSTVHRRPFRPVHFGAVVERHARPLPPFHLCRGASAAALTRPTPHRPSGCVPSAHANPIKYRAAPSPSASSWACRTSAFMSRWLPWNREPTAQPAAGRQMGCPIPPGRPLRSSYGRRWRCHVSSVPGKVPTNSNRFFDRRSPRIRSFTAPPAVLRRRATAIGAHQTAKKSPAWEITVSPADPAKKGVVGVLSDLVRRY